MTEVPRLRDKLLLSPQDLPPSDDQLRVVGVLNPGAIDHDDELVMLVRVVETPREQRPGHVGLPRWRDDGSGLVIDWVPDDQLTPVDARLYQVNATGTLRLSFTSHLRIIRYDPGLNAPRADLAAAPRLLPASPMETFGIEDPRITRLDGQLLITCVAVSPHGACTTLMRTTDFRTFDRLGVIFPPENKDVLLLPERVAGRYVALHRPNPNMHFSRPEMWLAESDDLIHWGRHRPLRLPAAPPGGLAGGNSNWSTGRIGGGAPPVRTDRGWLELYHGNNKAAGSASEDVGAYFGAAMLLDPDDPSLVLGHTPEPLLAPRQPWERQGFLPDIVFPTAMLDRGDQWLVIHGAADCRIGAAWLDKRAVDDAIVPVDATRPGPGTSRAT